MSDQIVIQKAELKDSGSIAALGRKTFLAAHEGSTPVEDMDRYLNEKFSVATVESELSDPKNIFYTLQSGDDLAGYSKIIYNATISLLPENNNACKLERLYISENYYGKKLGYKLFDFNKNLCIENQQSGIWLTVWVENERAIAFYDRVGFRIIGEILFTVGTQKSPNYVMWLEF